MFESSSIIKEEKLQSILPEHNSDESFFFLRKRMEERMIYFKRKNGQIKRFSEKRKWKMEAFVVGCVDRGQDVNYLKKF